MERPALTLTQRRLVAAVTLGGAVIAGIGFAGSYAAVRHLAEAKGFGTFALAFPIGIDAGIGVLLALDLLLTWLRMPYPMLRPTAWLLTAATIAFNAATAWPDPIGVGMHAVIPVLFIVTVEAARHAVGRAAAITADRHMEPVRLWRWILAPVPTFRLWRRMKLWELRSYEQAITLERDQLVYRARLQAEFGRSWRRKAAVAQLLPLRLARYGRQLPTDEPTTSTFDEAATEAVAVATVAPAPAALPAAPFKPRRQPPSVPAGPVWQVIDNPRELFGHAHAPIVYFIRNGNRVKIGTSQNLRRRIGTLCLRPDDLLFALHGTQQTEAALHKGFNEQRVGDTEWFEITGHLAEYIAEKTGTPVDASPEPEPQPEAVVEAPVEAPPEIVEAQQVTALPPSPAGLTKAALVLSAASALQPDASPAGIALHLARQGCAVDTSYVRTVLAREARKTRQAPGIGQGGEGYN